MAVPAEQTGVANAMNANLRGIGGTVGVAVVSSLITAHLHSNGYPDRSGYTMGWIVLASVAAIAAVATLALPGRPPRSAAVRLVDESGLVIAPE